MADLTEHTIGTLIVVWDEMGKTYHGESYSQIFERDLRSKLPVDAKLNIVFYSQNQMGCDGGIKKILHNQEFISHQENRPLAVLKFCLCGFIDENETYYHILKQWRNDHAALKAPIERCVCVIFITTDKSQKMQEALNWYNEKRESSIKMSNKHLFGIIQTGPIIGETGIKKLTDSVSSFLTEQQKVFLVK